MTDLLAQPLLTLAQNSGGEEAAIVIFGGVLLTIGCVFSLVVFIFWIWMLIDCIQRDFEGNGKVVWLLVILLLGFIGALIYLIVGRGQGVKSG